jgi:hypothetical protein
MPPCESLLKNSIDTVFERCNTIQNEFDMIIDKLAVMEDPTPCLEQLCLTLEAAEKQANSAKNDKSERNVEEELNVYELGEKIKKLLNEYGILFECFSSNVLALPVDQFNRLVSCDQEEPSERRLSRTQLKWYKVIQKWTMAKPEDFENLKKLQQPQEKKSYPFRKSLLLNGKPGPMQQQQSLMSGEEVGIKEEPLVYDNDEQQLNNEYDVHELVRRLKTTRVIRGITVKGMADILNVPISTFERSIYSPKPWRQLTEERKHVYCIIHDWLLQNERTELNDSVTVKFRRVRRPNSRIVRKRVALSSSLNTCVVVLRLKEMLDRNGIDYNNFASRTLRIQQNYFDKVMSEPKPWASLSEEDKILYSRMQKWSLARPNEIAELKESALKYRISRRLNVRRRRRRGGLVVKTENED